MEAGNHSMTVVARSGHTLRADRLEIGSYVFPGARLKMAIQTVHHFGEFFAVRIAPMQTFDKCLRAANWEDPAGLTFADQVGTAAVGSRQDGEGRCRGLREHHGESVLDGREKEHVAPGITGRKLALRLLRDEFGPWMQTGRDRPGFLGHWPDKSKLKALAAWAAQNRRHIQHSLSETKRADKQNPKRAA